MLVTLKAHLIGKSEVRHSQGGFVLTFLSQSAAGQQQIQSWIPSEEGEKFPFGPKLDGDGIPLPQGPDYPDNTHPQVEYTIAITDSDLASDELVLHAEIERLEKDLATSNADRDTQTGKVTEVTEELQDVNDELTKAKEQVNELAQEKANLIAAADASAEREAQLNETVNKLNEELAERKAEKAAEAESKVDPEAGAGAGAAAGAEAK